MYRMRLALVLAVAVSVGMFPSGLDASAAQADGQPLTITMCQSGYTCVSVQVVPPPELTPSSINVSDPGGPTGNPMEGGPDYGPGFAICSPHHLDVTMPSAKPAEFVAYEEWVYSSQDGQSYASWTTSGWYYQYNAQDIFERSIRPGLGNWYAPDGSLGDTWGLELPAGFSYRIRQHIYWYGNATSPPRETWVWAVTVPELVGFLGTTQPYAACGTT